LTKLNHKVEVVVTINGKSLTLSCTPEQYVKAMSIVAMEGVQDAFYFLPFPEQFFLTDGVLPSEWT
jgi:hypothetical protein